MTYNVTCPKTRQPIHFDRITEVRAFVQKAMNKPENKDCFQTVHIYNGHKTVGTMRKTERGVVFRSSKTHQDHLLNKNGTYKE